MVLKMTLSFTRSMAPQPTSDAIKGGLVKPNASSERKVSTATVAAKEQLNQREGRSESVASSSSSIMMDDVGLDDEPQDIQDEKSVEMTPQSQAAAPARGSTAVEGLSHGLIEISLCQEEGDGDDGLSASDLEAIDELIECAKEGDLPHFQRIAQSLLRRHITPDCAGYMGWTSAHWAARHGHVHILEYLRQEEVNLDLLDKKGDSLLHKAAANGQFRICQWLLQHGFNVQAKNNNGQTPLDVAQELLAMTRSTEAALCESILARENANTF